MDESSLGCSSFAIALHPFQRIIRYGDFEMGIKIDNTNMYRSPVRTL